MLREMSNVQFGEFTLDRYTRELSRQGTVLPVSGKAFDLLSYGGECGKAAHQVRIAGRGVARNHRRGI